jgi:probable phosphoglycerate mutase
MPETELILLRHGETDWNRERRVQGQLDTPLNAEGHRQALAAARHLSSRATDYRLEREPDRPAPLLLSSDLQRCRQTAAPIGTAAGLEVSLDERLRERHYGAFEGRTLPEAQRELGARFDRWLARDPDFDVGGGESLRVFAKRVEDALRDLVERHAGRTLVIVTHGGVLDIVNRIARAVPLEAPRDVEIPNASLSRLRHGGGRFEIRSWGEVSHWRRALDEVGPGAS